MVSSQNDGMVCQLEVLHRRLKSGGVFEVNTEIQC